MYHEINTQIHKLCFHRLAYQYYYVTVLSFNSPLLSLVRTFGRLVFQDVPTPLATWVSLHDPRRHARSKGATIILSSQGVVLVVK